jgi:outer membrane lipoprotein SlyB
MGSIAGRRRQGKDDEMKHAFGALALLAAMNVLPVEPAEAQDALIGGVLGGAAGAAIGGAVSGSVGGAIAGGIIGGATGAIIGNEAERRRNGYYFYRSGCYVQVGYNQYRRVSRRYCY